MADLIRSGDVRWYKFARPDRRRPVVVLSRDSVIEYLGEVTIAPVTSTVRDVPSEVLLTPDDGLPKDCAVNLDHIQTVSKSKVEGLITKLSNSQIDEIRQSLLFALGFAQ
jgi:mRNA interferase MazF